MSYDGDTAAVAWGGDDESDPHSRWLNAEPGDGSLSRVDAVKDEVTRRWDVITPSATMIGRATDPSSDLRDSLRRLHDEQHPAMAGHSARMHQLDKLRIAHALCSTLDVTRWERDCVLGIVNEVDFTKFGSQRALETVSLVVLRYVVDRERRERLGLDDTEWVASLSESELEELFEQFSSLKDDETFQKLLAVNDLTKTNVNRLTRVLKAQLTDMDVEGAVLGRDPFRDPNLPAVREPERVETRENGSHWPTGNGDGEPGL
ncbi:DNA-directed RNA polymerase subunit epsilon [Haloarchaeobius sp. DFWS5]|uniref:DNA-directed RNA polymerase subunit epsilon n=1 Tax=Haloarchaeobius sp. DFWS5 TaxID=3446114 RepID=UPI003EB77865